MPRYAYRLVNVFGIGDDPFSGNPLCVFEDARGLRTEQMQALALQFNLSETTFILPSTAGDARARIFTPTVELAFAGHPTLGTAYVVHTQRELGTRVRLELGVGVVPVTGEGARWTLQAPASRTRPVAATRGELAELLGISQSEIAEPALWVSTGNDQLLVPVTSADALARCRPDIAGLQRHARVSAGGCIMYVFAALGGDQVSARLFFNVGNSVVEDPATGSACANLGGYLIATGASLPLTRDIDQGRAVGRPSQLRLTVNAEAQIFVTGAVRELGRGVIELPA
ncbi:MAG: PhzF family phenazine biosynthesis protein [Polyangiales bacterium]